MRVCVSCVCVCCIRTVPQRCCPLFGARQSRKFKPNSCCVLASCLHRCESELCCSKPNPNLGWEMREFELSCCELSWRVGELPKATIQMQDIQRVLSLPSRPLEFELVTRVKGNKARARCHRAFSFCCYLIICTSLPTQWTLLKNHILTS